MGGKDLTSAVYELPSRPKCITATEALTDFTQTA